MGTRKDSAISRREFARRAALVSAAASLAPSNLLAGGPPEKPLPTQQPANALKLSPESQIENEARIQSILAQYGARLTDEQKADLRRLSTEAQASLERLRSFHVENSDGPALYLKPLVEREKKPVTASAAPRQSATPKSS